MKYLHFAGSFHQAPLVSEKLGLGFDLQKLKCLKRFFQLLNFSDNLHYIVEDQGHKLNMNLLSEL